MASHFGTAKVVSYRRDALFCVSLHLVSPLMEANWDVENFSGIHLYLNSELLAFFKGSVNFGLT